MHISDTCQYGIWSSPNPMQAPTSWHCVSHIKCCDKLSYFSSNVLMKRLPSIGGYLKQKDIAPMYPKYFQCNWDLGNVLARRSFGSVSSWPSTASQLWHDSRIHEKEYVAMIRKGFSRTSLFHLSLVIIPDSSTWLCAATDHDAELFRDTTRTILVFF